MFEFRELLGNSLIERGVARCKNLDLTSVRTEDVFNAAKFPASD